MQAFSSMLIPHCEVFTVQILQSKVMLHKVNFGTAKNLAQQPQSLKVTFRNQLINATTTYKYLGVHIDHSLNMNSNFNITYKKACGRLRLLRKIRPFLNTLAAKAIYQGMIVPILTYCGLINLHLSQSREDKLLAFHHRALDIIRSNTKYECDIKLKPVRWLEIVWMEMSAPIL